MYLVMTDSKADELAHITDRFERTSELLELLAARYFLEFEDAKGGEILLRAAEMLAAHEEKTF